MILINIVNEVSDEYLLSWIEQPSQFKISEYPQNIPPCKNHSLRIYLDLMFCYQVLLAWIQLPRFNYRSKFTLDSKSQTFLLVPPTLWGDEGHHTIIDSCPVL